jgi:hypothetical protein
MNGHVRNMIPSVLPISKSHIARSSPRDSLPDLTREHRPAHGMLSIVVSLSPPFGR